MCLHIVCLSGILCLHRPDLHLFCVNSCWDWCRTINRCKLKHQHTEKGDLRDPLSHLHQALAPGCTCIKQTAWLKSQPEILKMGQMLPPSWLNQFSLLKNETQPEAQGEDVLLRACVLPCLPWNDFSVNDVWLALPALALTRLLPFILFLKKKRKGSRCCWKILLPQFFNEI